MKALLFGMLALIAAFGAREAVAAQPAACGSVLTVPSGGAFVYKNSAPLRDSRGAIVSYRLNPTLISNRRTLLNRQGTTVLDARGNKLGKCPWTSAHGFSGGRYRCTMQTPKLRSTAQRNTGSPSVFFKLNGSACAKIPHAGSCYGSVKGPCNRKL